MEDGGARTGEGLEVSRRIGEQTGVSGLDVRRAETRKHRRNGWQCGVSA